MIILIIELIYSFGCIHVVFILKLICYFPFSGVGKSVKLKAVGKVAVLPLFLFWLLLHLYNYTSLPRMEKIVAFFFPGFNEVCFDIILIIRVSMLYHYVF
jgi:hypothetical protein